MPQPLHVCFVLLGLFSLGLEWQILRIASSVKPGNIYRLKQQPAQKTALDVRLDCISQLQGVQVKWTVKSAARANIRPLLVLLLHTGVNAVKSSRWSQSRG
jgi:hypothetical protein